MNPTEHDTRPAPESLEAWRALETHAAQGLAQSGRGSAVDKATPLDPVPDPPLAEVSRHHTGPQVRQQAGDQGAGKVAGQVNDEDAVQGTDSGVRSGLDILRACSLGADFVLLGRPFFYGIAALGKHGADHVTSILREELIHAMRARIVRRRSMASSF